jgi:hypothetical protein
LSDRSLNDVMVQYFNNQPIKSTFLGSHKLTGAAPMVVSQGDAELLVSDLQKQDALDGADLATTFVNLLLPSGTELTTDEMPTSPALSARLAARRTGKSPDPAAPVEDEATSKTGLGGFHGSVRLTMSGVGVTVYYAVSVFSKNSPMEPAQASLPFRSPGKTSSLPYHELTKPATDPDVEEAIRTGQSGFVGWTSKSGEEVGRPHSHRHWSATRVQGSAAHPGGDTVPVQFMYSNAVHGSEDPIPQPH